MPPPSSNKVSALNTDTSKTVAFTNSINDLQNNNESKSLLQMGQQMEIPQNNNDESLDMQNEIFVPASEHGK